MPEFTTARSIFPTNRADCHIASSATHAHLCPRAGWTLLSNIPWSAAPVMSAVLPAYERTSPVPLASSSSGGGIDAQLAQLAIKGGAADPEPASNFGHSAAVVADGEPDDVGLDFFERP